MEMIKIKRIAPGYYETRFSITLIERGEERQAEGRAEIFNRADEGVGSGWTYTLRAENEKGEGTYLSECADVYDSKKQIVEFLNSPVSRRWEFVRQWGLNCWCLSMTEAK